MVQAFLKKWWVESDFKTPNLPLSLRLKVSLPLIATNYTLSFVLLHNLEIQLPLNFNESKNIPYLSVIYSFSFDNIDVTAKYCQYLLTDSEADS